MHKGTCYKPPADGSESEAYTGAAFLVAAPKEGDLPSRLTSTRQSLSVRNSIARCCAEHKRTGWLWCHCPTLLDKDNSQPDAAHACSLPPKHTFQYSAHPLQSE